MDSDAEQVALEALIDQAKPPTPRGARFPKLHYLLSTPFRHPPLKHGSRFGTRQERGIFYASETLATGFAEVAYYRFLFYAGASVDLGLIRTELTAFQLGVKTEKALDLTQPPFDAFDAHIHSPTRYSDSQTLGSEMRAAGVEAVRYRSARCPQRRMNLALFEPVFRSSKPDSSSEQVWVCLTTSEQVEIKRRKLLGPHSETLSFERRVFLSKGKLPAPAV